VAFLVKAVFANSFANNVAKKLPIVSFVHTSPGSYSSPDESFGNAFQL